MSTRKKSIKRSIDKKVALLLPSPRTTAFFLVGFFLVATSLLYFNYRAYRLSFNRLPTKVENENNLTTIPTELQIARLNVTLPVQQSKIVNGIWQISENGASYLAVSSRPNQKGSIIIYGHNSQKILGPLRNAIVGDIINVKTRSGVIYSYRVKDIVSVSPKAVHVLESSGEETLIVYTCAGFADTKRLVVKATPL